MNNPLNLSIGSVPGVLPKMRIIPSSEIELYESTAERAEALVLAAQAQCRALEEQSQARLEETRCEAEMLLENARQEASALAAEARRQAIACAVEWCCEEHLIEQKIACHLNLRWSQMVMHLLNEIFDQCDQNALLLSRAEQMLAELDSARAIQLQVSRDAHSAALKRWGDDERIQIRANISLTQGQAVLDNGLVRLYLDTAEEQRQVLEQLTRYQETNTQ